MSEEEINKALERCFENEQPQLSDVDKSINQLTLLQKTIPISEYRDCFKTAIEALREKVERGNGCIHCGFNGNPAKSMHCYTLVVNYNTFSEKGQVNQRFKYCPYCGRPLKT